MKILPILLALIMVSSIASAQFGGGYGTEEMRDYGEPGKGVGPGGPGGFNMLDNVYASDVAGDVTTLITLKATNLLLSALPQGKNVFKEACADDTSKLKLINDIFDNYNANLPELKEICDSFRSRAQNFNDQICSPEFRDFPVPPDIRRAAKTAGITISLDMSTDDIKKICLVEMEEKIAKENEFKEKRFLQEAERYKDECTRRMERDEERKRMDEERRKMEEERWTQEQGRWVVNEFDPFKSGPGDQGPGGWPEQNRCPDVQPPNDCYPCGPEYVDGCATGRCTPCETQHDDQPWCGDGMCNEPAETCEKDCGRVGPECGDGRCEGGEDSYSCSPDCGSPPEEPPYEEPPYEEPPIEEPPPEEPPAEEPPPEGGLKEETYTGVILFQEDFFGPGPGYGNDFGPGFDDKGFGPGYGDDFGPGGPGYEPFGPGPGGPGYGPEPGFGPGPDYGAGPDFGPGGPGYGPGPSFGPFDDQEDCGKSVEELVQVLKEFESEMQPDFSEFGEQMCNQMAFEMADKIAQMKLQKDLHEESCKLRMRRQSASLQDAASACDEAIMGETAKRLITETTGAKCELIKFREARRGDLRNSFRAAVGLYDLAEETGSVALESTAVSIVNEQQKLQKAKGELGFFDTLFGNEEHGEKALRTAEEFEERIDELKDLKEDLDSSSKREIENQIEELETEVEKTKNRGNAFKAGIFGFLGRLGSD